MLPGAIAAAPPAAHMPAALAHLFWRLVCLHDVLAGSRQCCQVRLHQRRKQLPAHWLRPHRLSQALLTAGR